MSGGRGAFGDLWPIDASFPVRNNCTACRVRSTCDIVVKTRAGLVKKDGCVPLMLDLVY